MVDSEIRMVGVHGTGVIAEGVAGLCLDRGLPVTILSGSPERAARLAASLGEQHPDGEIKVMPARIDGCQLVVEATVESLAAKQEVLSEIEARCGADALLATTTSSLSITELGSVLRRPDRLVGMHFFNPVHRMALVEVVGGLRTSPVSIERARSFAVSLGKEPLTVPDRAGFLVNRLLIPYLNQAAWLVEQGMATCEDVDDAMRLGAGHPMGPFALIDLIGADVCLAIGQALHEEFKRTIDAPSSELRRRVTLGWLGRKTGRGYYDYG